MKVQCTDWINKDEVLKLGKVVFLYSGESSWRGFYNVPYPKKVISAIEWCQKHAEYVGGWVEERGNRIAVFRFL